MTPIEIERVRCYHRKLDTVGTDEADFFAHREEKFERWSIRSLCKCQHSGDPDTVIGTERGAIGSKYLSIVDDLDSQL